MTELVQALPDTGADATPLVLVDDDFWNTHAWIPLALFLPVFCGIEWFGLDRALAHALFYDTTADRWLGAGAGDWWADDLIHDAGRWLPRSIGGRRPAGLARILQKVVCARGVAPRLRLRVLRHDPRRAGRAPEGLHECRLSLGPCGLRRRASLRHPVRRPSRLAAARGCFPGAHSSSGFALLAVYFALRDRARRARAWRWSARLAVGGFSLGQEARGAHFLSHDLTSAAIAWFVLCALLLSRSLGRWTKRAVKQSRASEYAAMPPPGSRDVAREAQPQPGGQHADQPRIEQRQIEPCAAPCISTSGTMIAASVHTGA